MFDEDKLTAYWHENSKRFAGCFTLNEFLQWCWEWYKACEKIKTYAEYQRRARL